MLRCVSICARLYVHTSLATPGIVNTDSFQLESALSNKQTSGEESGEVYREVAQQHETSAQRIIRGGGGGGGVEGGGQAQVDEQSMLGMQMKAVKPSTRSTGRSEWQPGPV